MIGRIAPKGGNVNKKIMRRIALAVGALLVMAMVSAGSALATNFTVKTEAASGIGAFKAQLNGSYYAQEAQGGYAGFEYGTTEAFGQESSFTRFEASWPHWVSAPQLVEGLQPETTYYFRFGVAGYSSEVSYGNTLSFTTRSLPRFEAAEYLAKVTAAQKATNPMAIGIDGTTLECGKFDGTATMLAATTGLKLTPAFSECVLSSSNGGSWQATVVTNGCTEVLHPGDNAAPSGSLDISCPEGKSIELTAAATCNVSIPAQTGLKTVTATTETAPSPDTINAAFGVTNLTYVKTKDGFGCPLNGTGTVGSGTLTGTQTLSALNSSGTGDDLKIGY